MRILMPTQNSNSYFMAVDYDRHSFCVGKNEFNSIS